MAAFSINCVLDPLGGTDTVYNRFMPLSVLGNAVHRTVAAFLIRYRIDVIIDIYTYVFQPLDSIAQPVLYLQQPLLGHFEMPRCLIATELGENILRMRCL